MGGFSYIEETLSEFMVDGYVILGDINARHGKYAKDVLMPLNASYGDELLCLVIIDDIMI